MRRVLFPGFNQSTASAQRVNCTGRREYSPDPVTGSCPRLLQSQRFERMTKLS